MFGPPGNKYRLINRKIMERFFRVILCSQETGDAAVQKKYVIEKTSRSAMQQNAGRKKRTKELTGKTRRRSITSDI
jgi:hypothetical protein